MKKREDLPERRARTCQDAAVMWATSLSTVKRAISHGLVRVVFIGNRPIVPPEECERVARDGLPNIPPGYKRMTKGPFLAGRKRKAVPLVKGRKRDGERTVAA